MFSAKQLETIGFTANLKKDTSSQLSYETKGLSAFQILLSSLLSSNGNMTDMPKKFKGALRCSVKETSPNFLITDGSYFVSAYFTEQSYK